MPRLTAADELLVHQLPEPLPNVATHSEHWRESYFFVLHPRTGPGDVVILTMATFPARAELDSLQMGRIDGTHVFARHARAHGDDPHTTAVGPVRIDIVEPYRTVRLRVEDDPAAAFTCDLTFTARTAAYGLRRGTMKARSEVIWDQSHMFQAGTYSGTYSVGGTTHPVDTWWGQRDHSWGIRHHARCPMWMWLIVQLPEGMLGVWHWELAEGATVYTDGCFAPVGDGDPVPVVGFRHDLGWTDGDGRPADYGRDGEGVRGLAGRIEVDLADGTTMGVEGAGTWAMPYGSMGGGQHLMAVRTDDGREGSAIYEVTGASHHRYFPVARSDDLPT
ncbi:hypothetical protein BH18ACT1_BH18ACT1_11420 [soil metagenome]